MLQELSTLKIRFYIDPKTKDPHIHRHKVTEQEVEEVLSHPGEDRIGHEGTRVAIGQTRVRQIPSCCLCARTREYICDNSIRFIRKSTDSLPKTYAKKEKMRLSKLPPGWNEERVQRVLAHYESQTDEEAVAEDEAAYEGSGDMVMEIPYKLIPIVRDLIAQTSSAEHAKS